MVEIHPSLLDQLARGNVLLFVGDLVFCDPQGRVAMEQLALKLANHCQAERPQDYSLAEAAQLCEENLGRAELVDAVRDFLSTTGEEPDTVHRLIARLDDCKVVVTTCIDSRLERAFEDREREFHLIVDDIDVPFGNGEQTLVYKIRGSIDNQRSLVLSEDDHERFLHEQESITHALKAYLASKTILFLGYDLGDSQFRLLYTQVMRELDKFARRSYAVGSHITGRVRRWCERKGITVVETEVEDYLEALVAQSEGLARPASSEARPADARPVDAPLPRRPYMFLANYEPDDEAIFFGRGHEEDELVSRIVSYRLLVLFGASGVGKTSLLRAGVEPRLARADPAFGVVYVRGRADPGGAVRQTVRRHVPDGALPEERSLVDFLNAAATALEKPLVIVFDQFEEFFSLQADPELRRAFVDELGDVVDARNVPVKVVLSLREDWLAYVSEVESRIPEAATRRLRLLPLTRRSAKEAITKPAEALGFSYAREVVDRILDDLTAASEMEMQEHGGRSVMPPQLQVVCDALYQRAVEERRQVITVEDYEALGGAEGILAEYLDRALHDHAGGDRDVARAVLVSLLAGDDMRAQASREHLAARSGADEETLDRVLGRLEWQRLIRRPESEECYELTHDLLAKAIGRWANAEELRLQQAQELLQRARVDWERDHAILPGQGTFRRLDALRDDLGLTGDEVELMLRTAVLYDEEAPYWLARVSHTASVDILLEMAQHDVEATRLHAIVYLGDYGNMAAGEALAEMAMHDSSHAVRDSAASRLGEMGSAAGAERLSEFAAGDDGDERRQAVRALALMRDRLPELPVTLPASLRRQIFVKMGKLRFRRGWPWIRQMTVAGAMGGAVAFSVGVTPMYALDRSEWGLLLFIAALMALFGLVAGAVLGFGYSSGPVLLREHHRWGQVAGAVLAGCFGFAVALSPLALAGERAAASILGGALWGIFIGLGVSVPVPGRRGLAAQMAAGAIGGALGLSLYAQLFLGSISFEWNTRLVVLLFGALSGLVMAFAIHRQESQRARRGEDAAGEALSHLQEPAGDPQLS